MPTQNVGLSAQVTTTPFVQTITSGYTSGGTPLASTLATSGVNIINVGPGNAQYRIDNGDWVLLDRNEGNYIPADLSVNRVSVKRTNDSLPSVKIEYVAESKPTAYIGMNGESFPVATPPVTITGYRYVDSIATAVPGAGYAFTAGQWYRDGAAISGQTALTYTRLLADVGTALTFIPTGVAYSAAGGATLAEVVYPLETNYATRIYQTNASYSSPVTVYNGATLFNTSETNVTGTSMLVTEIEGDATHIQLIVANMHTVTSRTCNGFTVVCPDAIGDKRYDSLFAAAPVGTFNGGSATGVCPPRAAADTSANFIMSDEYPITPVARTDGGTKFLIAIREACFYPAIFNSADAGLTNPGNWNAPYFAHSGADWNNTAKPGFYLAVGVRDNKLNSAIGVTPDGSKIGAILGFRVKYKNRAATFAWFGSSYLKSDLTSLAAKQGAGFVMESALAVSTPDRPVEFINGGQAGQQLDKGILSAQVVIPLVKPSHVVIEYANPNNLSSVTAPILDTLRGQANTLIALAETNRARPVLFNGWARNSGTLPCTAPYFTAPQQVLLNAYVAERVGGPYPVINTRTGMSAGTIPDTIKMIANGFAADYAVAATGDGLHQTLPAQNEVLIPVATAALAMEANKYF